MIEAHPEGEHMPLELYKKVIEFSTKFDRFLIFLSGGEPTEHPDFLECAQIAKFYVKQNEVATVLVASNGMFLENDKYTDEILRLDIPIQITNDDRFYPKQIKRISHPLLNYVDRLTLVSPMGKALNTPEFISRQSPMCFNLRSIAMHTHSFIETIEYLRSRMKMCTPSINIDGSVVSGESSSCYKFGTVASTGEELMEGLTKMHCGKCGLYKNLQGQARSIWDVMENV
jgi:hypothetical protein